MSQGARSGRDPELAARRWLEAGTDVNMVQQRASAGVYSRMASSGKTASGQDVVRNIGNEGALA